MLSSLHITAQPHCVQFAEYPLCLFDLMVDWEPQLMATAQHGKTVPNRILSAEGTRPKSKTQLVVSTECVTPAALRELGNCQSESEN